tara:strand:- start:70608 stop:71345 length:738 start_codon:yes stop_codon:yes gene_type:complete
MNNAKKSIIIIPARIGSTRLKNKPLLDIDGKPMILHVWERAIKAKSDMVIVATDSEDILQIIKSNGGEAVLTSPNHKSGSDRVYEALQKIENTHHQYDYIINLQGDLPNINTKIINIGLKEISKTSADILTYCSCIDNKEEIENKNIVKVAIGQNRGELNGIYFSRSPIPHGAEIFYEHVGIYIYKRNALSKFISSKPTKLEITEKLEQLRALENNLKINLILIDDKIISIDTIDDLNRLKNYSK